MDFGTENKEKLLQAQQGARVRECREMRGLTREELIERIEALPENGSTTRSEKQIDYLERGVRPMSARYCKLLSKALSVREQYLLCEDDFITENDRISHIAGQQFDRASLIQNLLVLHNFLIEDTTAQQPIQTDAQGRQYRENRYELVSPHGSRRSFSAEQLAAFFERIDDFVEMFAAFQFQRLEDGATNKYDWRV